MLCKVLTVITVSLVFEYELILIHKDQNYLLFIYVLYRYKEYTVIYIYMMSRIGKSIVVKFNHVFQHKSINIDKQINKMCVCPFTCQSVRLLTLSVCTGVCQSVCLLVCLSVCCLCTGMYIYICHSVCSFICLF